jgi:signal transduction histidine kinase
MRQTSGVYFQSVKRAFVLAGSALAGVADLVLVVLAFCLLCVGLFFFFAPAVEHTRLRIEAVRRRAGIPSPYTAEPPMPEREADGWFREGNSLYKTPKWINRFHRVDWIGKDPATCRDLGWLTLNPLAGLVLPLATMMTGPWALRVYDRWTMRRLGPPPERAPRSRPRVWRWLRTHFEALWHQVALFGLSVAQLAMVVPQFAVFLMPWWLFPTMTTAARSVNDQFRLVATEWVGVRIDRPYLPPPPFPVQREDGLYRAGNQLHEEPWWPMRRARMRWVVGDRATWRDLAAAALNPLVSGLLALPVLIAVVYGFVGLQCLWLWRPLDQANGGGDSVLVTWFKPLGLPAVFTNLQALAVTPVALALMFVPVAFSLWLVGLQARFGRWLLGSTEASRLALRVRRLERTRTDSTDAQAEELRRIERDLHDGVQSRLVAMGMKLGAVEALIDREPAAAKKLAAELRESSSAALTELRELVRGIQPPVLSERGLIDAVRAVALDSPLSVDVTVDFDGRVEPPVESCVYFAVRELLTNAVKHGEAQRASIGLRYDGHALLVEVTDDGKGGANPARGTGLRGIERRLGAFDGKLTLLSPLEGTTTATMEIPCLLDSGPSSPKTSTSSETA